MLRWLLAATLFVSLSAPAAGQEHEEDEAANQVDHQQAEDHSESRFSDEPIPLADIPNRPRPILELGPAFLGTGTLGQGFKLPTGAVWQPAMMAFGTIRSALQGIDNGVANVSFLEAAARFDLFGNLYLTQTERLLIGFRPLDQDGSFTRYTIGSDPELPDTLGGFQDELNFAVTTLFFEGDIGEIFPNFDSDDSGRLDFGFSVGRQPLGFQDGMLINEDAIDAVGLTRANIRMGGLVNVRATGLFGWGQISRRSDSSLRNATDTTAILFGLFTETDTRTRTIELDAVYVSADDSAGGSGVYLGLGSTRRIGRYNHTFRVLASFPVGTETHANQQGVLIHDQLSWSPHHTVNHVYINTFAALGRFRSAARGPSVPGPLARTGILFAGVGLGSYGAAFSSSPDYSLGGSLGYQIFMAATRRQLLLEFGGRFSYGDEPVAGRDAIALGARYQTAVGSRGVIVLDAFGSYDLDEAVVEESSDVTFGGRVEVVIKL